MTRVPASLQRSGQAPTQHSDTGGQSALDLSSQSIGPSGFVTVGPLGGRILAVLRDLRIVQGPSVSMLPSEIYDSIVSSRILRDPCGGVIGRARPNGFGYLASECRRLVALGVLEFREDRVIPRGEVSHRKPKLSATFALSEGGEQMWNQRLIYVRERRG